MDKKILFTGFVSFVAGVFADRLFEKFGKKTVTKVQFKEPKNEEKNVDLGKLIEPYRGENGKIEGVRCGLVVFALKDADTLMNFDRACDYCRKVEIAGRATTLPRAGLEQKVAPYFEALNQDGNALQSLHRGPASGVIALLQSDRRKHIIFPPSLIFSLSVPCGRG